LFKTLSIIEAMTSAIPLEIRSFFSAFTTKFLSTTTSNSMSYTTVRASCVSVPQQTSSSRSKSLFVMSALQRLPDGFRDLPREDGRHGVPDLALRLADAAGKDGSSFPEASNR